MITEFKCRWVRRLAQHRIRNGHGILQTDFFGCRMLVRPHEDVGRSMVFGDFETADLRHFIEASRDGDVVYDRRR